MKKLLHRLSNAEREELLLLLLFLAWAISMAWMGSGCQSRQVVAKPAIVQPEQDREASGTVKTEPPTPEFFQLYDEVLPWYPENDDSSWTIWAIDRIGSHPELVKANPSDIQEFCPKFKSLDNDHRILFYAHLLAKMAKYESNYNPKASYVECSSKSSTYGSSGKWFASRGQYCIPGSKLEGGVAISRGLFQMSVDSANAYGCGIESPSDLEKPDIAIECAVKVLNRFVPAPRMNEGKVRGHGRLAGKVDGVWKGAAAYWSVMRSNSVAYPKIKSYVAGLPFCR